MVQLNFDANQVPPNAGYEPVPEGWYNVAITESDVKPTKDGEGAMLVLKASIIDGPHANKLIFIRLNIQNKNQQAVDIAYRDLSAICHATGVYRVEDSSQLHNIPFQVRVTVRPAKDGYDASNEVKGYRDARGNAPGKSGQSTAPAMPNAQQSGQQPQNNWAQQNQQPPAQQNQQAPAWGQGQGQQPPAFGQGTPATDAQSGGNAAQNQNQNQNWTQQPASGGTPPWGQQSGN